jgi:hypothetical protein
VWDRGWGLGSSSGSLQCSAASRSPNGWLPPLARRLVSPEGTYTLQAANEYERAEWIAALQVSVCARLSSRHYLPRPDHPAHLARVTTTRFHPGDRA